MQSRIKMLFAKYLVCFPALLALIKAGPVDDIKVEAVYPIESESLAKIADSLELEDDTESLTVRTVFDFCFV